MPLPGIMDGPGRDESINVGDVNSIANDLVSGIGYLDREIYKQGQSYAENVKRRLKKLNGMIADHEAGIQSAPSFAASIPSQPGMSLIPGCNPKPPIPDCGEGAHPEWDSVRCQWLCVTDNPRPLPNPNPNPDPNPNPSPQCRPLPFRDRWECTRCPELVLDKWVDGPYHWFIEVMFDEYYGPRCAFFVGCAKLPIIESGMVNPETCEGWCWRFNAISLGVSDIEEARAIAIARFNDGWGGTMSQKGYPYMGTLKQYQIGVCDGTVPPPPPDDEPPPSGDDTIPCDSSDCTDTPVLRQCKQVKTDPPYWAVVECIDAVTANVCCYQGCCKPESSSGNKVIGPFNTCKDAMQAGEAYNQCRCGRKPDGETPKPNDCSGYNNGDSNDCPKGYHKVIDKSMQGWHCEPDDPGNGDDTIPSSDPPFPVEPDHACEICPSCIQEDE